LQLALADGVLYWTDRDHGTVNRLTLAGVLPGGAISTVASGEQAPGLIEARGGDVFWIDADSMDPSGRGPATARLRHATPDGALVDLATETNTNGGIRGLAVSSDGRTLFYSADTKVKAVPVEGGAPLEVGAEAHGGVPMALGVEGDAIGYVTDINGNVDVMTGGPATCGGLDPNKSGDPLMVNCVRIGGCTPWPLTERFLVRGARAIWADGTNLDMSTPLGKGLVYKDTIASTVSGNPITGLAASGETLYFAESGQTSSGWMGDGLIERTAGVPNSTPVALARAQLGPHSLVVDATDVYWATADCAINAVPR
jgi:hypothetical protein